MSDIDKEEFIKYFKATFIDKNATQEDVAYEFYKRGRAIIEQDNVEPVGWESITNAYTKYVTQSRYDKFSANIKRWYQPYKCVNCSAHPPKDSTEHICNAFMHKVSGDIKYVLAGDQNTDFSEWEDISIFKHVPIVDSTEPASKDIEPTEEMKDGARSFLAGLELGIKTFDDMASHLELSGAYLPRWFLESKGHLNKMAKAHYIYEAMNKATAPTTPKGEADEN